tara:strand:+ start:154 stop:969 length:816 start_codon:yes stop_codon:yes gene_type:complete
MVKKQELMNRSTETFFGEHIEESIEKYKLGYSKLNEKAKSMDGMIQEGARNLLNLLASFDGCRYMQIGTWKGACLYSALYKNNVEYAFACDDFSEYSLNQGMTVLEDGKMKTRIHLDLDVMLALMQPDEEGETIEFEFYNGDCFGMPLNKVKNPINMYFYDGGHNLGDHFLSLYYYYPVLADEFIFVCDDWSEEKVRAGTRAALEQCNYSSRTEHVHENLFIAHVVKDTLWGERLTEGRTARLDTHLYTLDNKEITKDVVFPVPHGAREDR